MNKNTIWGTICECGTPCFELQSNHHPWGKTDYIARLTCSNCGKVNHVDQKQSSAFYSNKIYELFDNIEGSVADFGCGGGFLTCHASQQDKVTNIFAIDIDKDCRKPINEISKDIIFIEGSTSELVAYTGNSQINELISRDVIMFIEDPQCFVKEISKVITLRVRILAWYLPKSERMKNSVSPEEFREMFIAENWKVELSFPNWYAYGYFIDAHRK